MQTLMPFYNVLSQVAASAGWWENPPMTPSGKIQKAPDSVQHRICPASTRAQGEEVMWPPDVTAPRGALTSASWTSPT